MSIGDPRRHPKRAETALWRTCAALAGAVMLSACGGRSSGGPTAPNPTQPVVSIAGNWIGTWATVTAGVRAVEDAQAVIGQDAAAVVSGTVTAASGTRGVITAKAGAERIEGSIVVSHEGLGLSCSGTETFVATLADAKLHVELSNPRNSTCDLGESGWMDLEKR